MTTSTVPVYVQPRNRPVKRRFAGYGSDGVTPGAPDYERWGVNPSDIYTTMFKTGPEGVWTMILIETNR